MDFVAERLAAARQELLDLGLRNPLLNFCPRQSRGLTIVDERPAQLFAYLVQQGQTMGFLPLAEEEPYSTPADWLPQPDDPIRAAERHEDDYLQTPYSSSVLQERLLNTYLAARAAIDEQGVNILYLALGMLHWRERGDNSPSRHAPLILLPVQLDREDATHPFRLAYTGAEISENLSLRFKLQTDFGLSLPPFPEVEPFAMTEYMAQVAAAMPPSFTVDPQAVHLGFFSFTRLTLYHDLDPANWPDAPPETHPFLQTLFTPETHLSAPLTHQESDPFLPHLVLDSDSSQAQAIAAIHQGQSVVIQGPPGTGKSQTITNLIAQAVGEGKTVLFVAEKLAALEVVKRRLDGVGLGDACLELHSHKTSRTSFLAELGHTLSLGEPKETGQFAGQPQWQAARDRLNGYHTAINTPIGASGLTPYQVIGRLVENSEPLAAGTLHSLTLSLSQSPALADLTVQQYADLRAWVNTLQTHLQQMGLPEQHPFWGSGRTEITPAHIAQLGTATGQAIAALQEWQAAAAALAAHLQLPPPETVAQARQLLTAADLLEQTPHLYGVAADDPAWYSEAKQILAGLDAAATISHHQANYGDLLIPEAWQQPVIPIRQALAAGQSRWGQWFSADYRRGRALLTGLCQQPIPSAWAEQMAVVDAILEYQRLHPILSQAEPVLSRLFTIRWQGAATDWFTLTQIAYWLTQLHQEIHDGHISPAILPYLKHTTPDKTGLKTARDTVHTAETAYYQARQGVLHLLQPQTDLPECPPPDAAAPIPFTAIHQRLHTWHSAAARWPEMGRFLVLVNRGQVAVSSGQYPLSQSPLLSLSPSHLLPQFEQTYYLALLEKAQLTWPVLRDVDVTAALTTALAQFQTLDVTFLQQNRYRLAHQHWQRLPRYQAVGQVGILQEQISKKRAQMAIRNLIGELGLAIQQIKPVMMMSPLSVATYLPPDAVQFDWVIFDEASQVRPAEALSAILRGRQVIIVGDSRQLPPTPFFERLVGGAEQESDLELELERDELVEPEREPEKLPESILDLCVRRQVPQVWLRWHYRSQHESLIALSNQEFYDNALVIFPSPDGGRQAVGLVLHHLPQTVYERGGSRTNPLEALVVAEKVMEHARLRPHLTLGVAAFSTAQQRAIWHQLEIVRRQHPDVEPFFQSHPAEPFFVKNLENVQGDERDVMLISLGYGFTAEKKLALNFGPLNQSGGERRLNVLITRARLRCELFSNFRAGDMDLRRSDAAGVIALHKLLEYAETGELPQLAPAYRPERDQWVEWLAAAFRQEGLRVRQPASRINLGLAVGDPARPGYDRLALMSDGGNAIYAPSARDRERLQAQVLAGLGWQPVRLWSWGWWQFPEREKGRLREEIERMRGWKVENELNQPFPPFTPPSPIERYDAAAPPPRPVPTYQTAAAFTANLTGDRGHWRYDKKNERFTSRELFRFDWSSRRFTPERLVPDGYSPSLEESTPGGELYGQINYYPLTGKFHYYVYFILVTPHQTRHQLVLNLEDGCFYTNPWYDTKDGFYYTRHRYEPTSGKLTTLLLPTNVLPRHLEKEIELPQEITAEVAHEWAWVEQIVAQEGPVHRDEVARRLALAAGSARRTVTADRLVKAAAAALQQQNRIRQVGEFLWPAAMTHPPVRDRSSLPALSRHFDFISPEETQEAILLVVQDGLGVLPEEIPQAVAQLFGFARVGESVSQLIQEQAAVLLAMNRLERRGRWITRPGF